MPFKQYLGPIGTDVTMPIAHVETLLTEAELADEFLQAITNRQIPEKFFYWSPLSVKAWLALCQDGAYRNFVRSDVLIRQCLSTVVRDCPGGPVEVVSLGAGSGTKDLQILKALSAAGHRVRYVPVDAGMMLLEMACLESARHGLDHRGVKADFTNPKHLAALASARETAPRLLLLLGNSLGAFDPPAMLAAVRALMRETDQLLVDGELGQDRETLAGYDNPTNRAFALAPLLSIGISETDGRLVFKALEDLRPGLHRLGKYFEMTRDCTITVGGLSVPLQAGDRIRMNHSGKYSRDGFEDLLQESGFSPIERFLSDDGRFLMVLARPAIRVYPSSDE
jgi:uncharacterized SAM-dependent methyltransferase